VQLLGATLVDKRRDTASALGYWRRAVALQAQCANRHCANVVLVRLQFVIQCRQNTQNRTFVSRRIR